MANGISTFQSPGLKAYFLSQRAKVQSDPGKQVADFINGAKKALLCAIYDLRDEAVLKALQKAAKRLKTRLHIVYDAGKGKPGKAGGTPDPKNASANAKMIHEFGLDSFATAVHLKGGNLMHDKFLVRDDADVWTGSGNFTNGGLVLQDNNFLAIHSSELAKVYTDTFNDLSHPAHALTHMPKAPGIAPPKPHKGVKVGAVTVTPYFTTGVNEFEDAETAVIKVLKSAKKVRIAAMLLGDAGILQALQQFKNKDIAGVLDPGQMRSVMPPPAGKSKQDPKLFWFTKDKKRFVGAKSHAFVPSDNNNFMHNKFMILDDRIVATGSYNFSEHAEVNDENMLIIQSPAVATAYTRYFDALFKEYKTNGKALPTV